MLWKKKQQKTALMEFLECFETLFVSGLIWLISQHLALYTLLP